MKKVCTYDTPSGIPYYTGPHQRLMQDSPPRAILTQKTYLLLTTVGTLDPTGARNVFFRALIVGWTSRLVIIIVDRWGAWVPDDGWCRPNNFDF